MSGPQCGPFLPHELLWEILSCLPVKALMRFSCVCKSWNSLKFDPTFVKLHLQQSSTNTSLLYTLRKLDAGKQAFSVHFSIERSLDNPYFTFDDGGIPLKFTYEVIGVCNGLVCLATATLEGGYVRVWVQFWNPATRLRSQKSCILQSLGFSVYVTAMGFGYDDSNDTYKVVAVCVNMITQKTELIVHYMGDTCWKKVARWSGFPTLVLNTATEETDGLYLAGTLNWIGATSVSDRYSLFSFDLRNETCRYLLLPRGFNIIRHKCSQFLGVLRGCLCFFHYEKATRFSVWQMKEFGREESWTMLLKFSCVGLQIFKYSFHQFPLCMNENGNLMLLDVGLEGFQVIIYNRRDDKLEKIHSFPTRFLRFFDYTQSLVLPYRNCHFIHEQDIHIM